jgi:hypothetical protein
LAKARYLVMFSCGTCTGCARTGTLIGTIALNVPFAWLVKRLPRERFPDAYGVGSVMGPHLQRSRARSTTASSTPANFAVCCPSLRQPGGGEASTEASSACVIEGRPPSRLHPLGK